MIGGREDRMWIEIRNLREERSGRVPREKGAYAPGSLIISGLAYHRSGTKRKASV